MNAEASEATIAPVQGRTAKTGRSASPWKRYAIFAAVPIVGGLIAASVFLLTFDKSVEGFRLKAETMVARDGPVLVDDLQCPADIGASPVEYSDTGVLMRELAVYEGELVSVRIELTPYDGPIPALVSFDALWPAGAVDGSGPRCAFLVPPADGSTPRLDWQTEPDGAHFEVHDASPNSATIVEVWLRAGVPEPGTQFRTELESALVGDQFVIEPLGGGVLIEPRPGVAVDLSLEAAEASIDGRSFDIMLVLANPRASGNVADLSSTLSTVLGTTWTIGDIDDGLDCTADGSVRCTAESIGPGGRLTAQLTAELPPGWSPDPSADCLTINGPGAALCVVAEAQSSIGSGQTTVTDALGFDVVRNEADGLEVTVLRAPIFARKNEAVTVQVGVRTTGSADLGSFEVIGTDCLTFERIFSFSDDGDAFIEPDELWLFGCELEPAETSTFRIDVSAQRPDAGVVAASLESIVTVIEPSLDVDIVDGDGDGDERIAVTNSGTGVVTAVSLAAPGCTAVSVDEGDAEMLEPGEEVVFVCVGGVVDRAGLVAFALDANEEAMSIRWE